MWRTCLKYDKVKIMFDHLLVFFKENEATNCVFRKIGWVWRASEFDEDRRIIVQEACRGILVSFSVCRIALIILVCRITLTKRKHMKKLMKWEKNNRKVSCDRVSWKEFLNFMKINGESEWFSICFFLQFTCRKWIECLFWERIEEKNMKTILWLSFLFIIYTSIILQVSIITK
jgi:hypothetical protein